MSVETGKFAEEHQRREQQVSIKGTVDVISSEPLSVKCHGRFTTVILLESCSAQDKEIPNMIIYVINYFLNLCFTIELTTKDICMYNLTQKKITTISSLLLLRHVTL